MTATVNGKHKVTGLTIKPEVVDPEDVEMLADLVTAAVNEAIRRRPIPLKPRWERSPAG